MSDPRRRRSAVTVIGIATIDVVAMLVAVWLLSGFGRPQVERVAPVAIEPLPVVGELTQSMSATVNLGATATLTHAAWVGVVTRVDLAPGDEIADGMPIGAVDGVTRSVCSGAPMYRPVTVGATGDDVDALLRCLSLVTQREFAGPSFDDAAAAALTELGAAVAPGSWDPRLVFAFTAQTGWTVQSTSLEIGHALAFDQLAVGSLDIGSAVIDEESAARATGLLDLATALGVGAEVRRPFADPSVDGEQLTVTSLSEIESELSTLAAQSGAIETNTTDVAVTLVVTVDDAGIPLFSIPVGALGPADQCVFAVDGNHATPQPLDVAGIVGANAYTTTELVDSSLLIAPQQFGATDCEHALELD